MITPSGEATMPDAYARDLIGYGANPPNPKWPGDVRIAINFVMNYEEGSEPSIPDGDGKSEGGLTEVAHADPGRQGRDLAAESMFEYGSRVGFWRVLRIFQERELPLTVFACALTRMCGSAGASTSHATGSRRIRLRRRAEPYGVDDSISLVI